MSRFYDCSYHGWSALGKQCPKCSEGNAPTVCAKHGWSHLDKPCPSCVNGDTEVFYQGKSKQLLDEYHKSNRAKSISDINLFKSKGNQ